MNEQMDIFSFIEKPQKDTTWRASKPSEVVREDETDPGYLGYCSEDYAKKIAGRQLNFSELEFMIGQRILWQSRSWLHGKDGTVESNRYMILKVASYDFEHDEIYDHDRDQYIGTAAGCLVQQKAGHPPLFFWLNELHIYGGKNAEDVGYKKREFIYKIKENL